ncbi:MAG: hypothetical protein ACF788_02815 [Novipirellula sp. JB048]
MPKFTEAKLEDAIIRLLADQGYPHVFGADIVRDCGDVLIRSDLRRFLAKRYAGEVEPQSTGAMAAATPENSSHDLD